MTGRDDPSPGSASGRHSDGIVVVVPAAGQSARYGAPKLLAPLRGRPLVRVTVERLLGADAGDIVVVTGSHAEEVDRALDGLPVRTVFNRRYAEGMGTSIAAGVRALPREGLRAVLIALADQPLPPRPIVEPLIRAHAAGLGEIIVPRFAGTRGHPVLFDVRYCDALARLSGDEGARALLESHAERVAVVEFDFPPPSDVDTPEDLERLR